MKGQWVEVKTPACRCEDKPSGSALHETHGDGSIWQCGCLKQWRLSWTYRGYEKPYPTWTLIETKPGLLPEDYA